MAGFALLSSTVGVFNRLIETDAWTMIFWRGFFGGLFAMGILVWRDRGRALATILAIGRDGLVVVFCSALATVCFLNALRLHDVGGRAGDRRHHAVHDGGSRLAGDRRARGHGHARRQPRRRAGRGDHGGSGLGRQPPAGRRAGLRHGGLAVGDDGVPAQAPRRRHDAGDRPLGLCLCARSCCRSRSLGDRRLGRLPAGAVRRAVRRRAAFPGARQPRVSATRTALFSILDTPLGPLWMWLGFGELPSTACSSAARS